MSISAFLTKAMTGQEEAEEEQEQEQEQEVYQG